MKSGEIQSILGVQNAWTCSWVSTALPPPFRLPITYALLHIVLELAYEHIFLVKTCLEDRTVVALIYSILNLFIVKAPDKI